MEKKIGISFIYNFFYLFIYRDICIYFYIFVYVINILFFLRFKDVVYCVRFNNEMNVFIILLLFRELIE